ncbi:MAG: T9SS type A sorting domain-containing protein [Bacteroidetes bacterium]|nr:T9SS type A sorting domain-containing protein [Bacteroidota bacterium]
MCSQKSRIFLHVARELSGSVARSLSSKRPYVNCIFSKQNKSENDARTNFYGIFGSTPRAVVQGKVIPPINPLVPMAAYDSTLNQSAPFELNLSMTSVNGSDSILTKAVIIQTDAHGYTTLNLFAVITEDTIFYNAPNGENVHYDVFHRQLFPGNGLSFTVPQNIGDSVVITSTFLPDPLWNRNRINVIGMIQTMPSKYIVQSAIQHSITEPVISTSIGEVGTKELFRFFPNPANREIYFQNSEEKNIEIYNTAGQLVKGYTEVQRTLNVEALPEGVYFLRIFSDKSTVESRKLSVIH